MILQNCQTKIRKNIDFFIFIEYNFWYYGGIDMELEEKLKSQQELWNNLKETDSLREVQQYIKAVNTVRGFENQPIEERMLLLTEEIGELAKSIRKNATNMSTDVNKQYSYDSIESEVSDCLYVLASVCNRLDIDMFKCLKEKEKENIHRVWKK